MSRITQIYTSNKPTLKGKLIVRHEGRMWIVGHEPDAWVKRRPLMPTNAKFSNVAPTTLVEAVMKTRGVPSSVLPRNMVV